MKRKAFGSLGALLFGTLLLALAACSGAPHSMSPSGMLPAAAPNSADRPATAATPPVTAPVKIPYPYTNNFTVTTWAGPSAPPVVVSGTDDGVTTVKFALDPKTNVYAVLETIVSKTGYTEALNSAITFPAFQGGTAQIILSDNYTYAAGSLTQTGLDTYPKTQDSFNFPLTPGRKWSAAAPHVSSYGIVQTGKGAFAQNVSTDVAANGSYTGQSSFSSTKKFSNQDNYASTTDVESSAPSTYTYSAPAAGFNPLTQTFAPPLNGKIEVTSSGKKPIPFPKGTVKVANWYPIGGGGLPRPLYADNFRVAGAATMPAQCEKREGQSATKVVETSYDIDPVQGFDNTYTATYYLTSLAPGQYWFACIIEAYVDTNYANGWIMSAGNWGTPSMQIAGTEILLAKGAKPSPGALRAFSAMHVLAFVPPALVSNRLANLGLRR